MLMLAETWRAGGNAYVACAVWRVWGNAYDSWDETSLRQCRDEFEAAATLTCVKMHMSVASYTPDERFGLVPVTMPHRLVAQDRIE